MPVSKLRLAPIPESPLVSRATPNIANCSLWSKRASHPCRPSSPQRGRMQRSWEGQNNLELYRPGGGQTSLCSTRTRWTIFTIPKSCLPGGKPARQYRRYLQNRRPETSTNLPYGGHPYEKWACEKFRRGCWPFAPLCSTDCTSWRLSLRHDEKNFHEGNGGRMVLGQSSLHSEDRRHE